MKVLLASKGDRRQRLMYYSISTSMEMKIDFFES